MRQEPEYNASDNFYCTSTAPNSVAIRWATSEAKHVLARHADTPSSQCIHFSVFQLSLTLASHTKRFQAVKSQGCREKVILVQTQQCLF